jgi:hypothetical protein
MRFGRNARIHTTRTPAHDACFGPRKADWRLAIAQHVWNSGFLALVLLPEHHSTRNGVCQVFPTMNSTSELVRFIDWPPSKPLH